MSGLKKVFRLKALNGVKAVQVHSTKPEIMAYSLYHIISTTVLESNSTLDTLKEYVNGAEIPFSKEEIVEMINSAIAHNNKLYKSANLVRQGISEEIF